MIHDVLGLGHVGAKSDANYNTELLSWNLLPTNLEGPVVTDCCQPQASGCVLMCEYDSKILIN